jgi:hypothetical protein
MRKRLHTHGKKMEGVLRDSCFLLPPGVSTFCESCWLRVQLTLALDMGPSTKPHCGDEEAAPQGWGGQWALFWPLP